MKYPDEDDPRPYCEVTESDGRPCGMPATSYSTEQMNWYLCDGHTNHALVAGWKPKDLSDVPDEEKHDQEPYEEAMAA